MWISHWTRDCLYIWVDISVGSNLCQTCSNNDNGRYVNWKNCASDNHFFFILRIFLCTTHSLQQNEYLLLFFVLIIKWVLYTPRLKLHRLYRVPNWFAGMCHFGMHLWKHSHIQTQSKKLLSINIMYSMASFEKVGEGHWNKIVISVYSWLPSFSRSQL